MNKTVNINLGGMFFHIDEDAYQKLTYYFEAIKRYLSNSDGQEEIMSDIETRISELLSEKLKNDKQVVNNRDIDEIIEVMGQPEDYRLDDDTSSAQEPFYSTSKKSSKKLYRDQDKGMVGGVAAGFGHYLGVDPIWLRILLIVLVFAGFGSGIVAYIVLWVVMPAAQTTTEKLEMTGEPVTISNIEKKVKEGFDNVSSKLKNTDYDTLGNSAKTGIEKILSTLLKIIVSILKIFSKFIGLIIIIVAISTLIGLLISIFTLGSTSFLSVPWMEYLNSMNYTSIPVWTIGLLCFFVIGIPFFFLFILGLKLVISNTKSIGNIAKYTLLAIWLISVALLITYGIKQATEVAFDSKVVKKEIIPLQQKDTLFIKAIHNNYYTKSVRNRANFDFVQDSLNNSLIYSNNIELHFLPTDEKQPFVQIEKMAQGKSFDEAKQRAEKIQYHYTVQNNKLVFDNYLLTEIANKYRNQEVKIFVYLPKGIVLYPDQSIQNYHRSYYSDADFYIEYGRENNFYKVENNELKCLTCTDEMDETDGIPFDREEQDSTTTQLTINDKGVMMIQENQKGKKAVKKVEINKKGVTIKTELP